MFETRQSVAIDPAAAALDDSIEPVAIPTVRLFNTTRSRCKDKNSAASQSIFNRRPPLNLAVLWEMERSKPFYQSSQHRIGRC